MATEVSFEAISTAFRWKENLGDLTPCLELSIKVKEAGGKSLIHSSLFLPILSVPQTAAQQR